MFIIHLLKIISLQRQKQHIFKIGGASYSIIAQINFRLIKINFTQQFQMFYSLPY